MIKKAEYDDRRAEPRTSYLTCIPIIYADPGAVYTRDALTPTHKAQRVG